jgi:hypothetical protein
MVSAWVAAHVFSVYQPTSRPVEAGRRKKAPQGPMMSAPDIIRKLAEEFNRGITTEVQVVYVLAEVKKQP